VSAVDHAVVIGDDVAQVGVELLGAGEVDGIKRTELVWQQLACSANDPVVDPHERDPGEDIMTELARCPTGRSARMTSVRASALDTGAPTAPAPG
jgi:hypothetical protein